MRGEPGRPGAVGLRGDLWLTSLAAWQGGGDGRQVSLPDSLAA
jgi:hypothetical protein